MKYYQIFTRSFNRCDQRRLRYGAWVVGCFVLTWCLCIAFNLYNGPLSVFNLRTSAVDVVKSMTSTKKTTKPELPYGETNETMLICNASNPSTKTCEMKGDVRIHGISSTIFVFMSQVRNSSVYIKPYARNDDEFAMKSVTKFTINTSKIMPCCTQTQNVPAIVFSGGGYSGNIYHAFSDIIIPLYATSRKFNGEVRFLLANKHPQWTTKFQAILAKLSKYEIIDIDHDNEVHCFPSMIVGLKKAKGKELYTNSMKNFTTLLRSSYSLERSTAIKINNDTISRPRLLIVSRKRTRAFTNVPSMVSVAQVLGFEVIMMEMNQNLTHVSMIVNSCDVMVGVHGAGLTNMVFLPENGVLIQVVPWGKMDGIAKTCFGEPTNGMGLKYLEYKISVDESSLIKQYPLNHQVLMDPRSIGKNGWLVFKSIYMEKQNVTLDLVKFKEILLKSLRFLH